MSPESGCLSFSDSKMVLPVLIFILLITDECFNSFVLCFFNTDINQSHFFYEMTTFIFIFGTTFIRLFVFLSLNLKILLNTGYLIIYGNIHCRQLHVPILE